MLSMLLAYILHKEVINYKYKLDGPPHMFPLSWDFSLIVALLS
jgi:hypothetical protein